MSGIKIHAVAPAGGGAAIVHAQLAAGLPHYHLRRYPPMLEYAPFLLPAWRAPADIVHCPADYAALFARRRQKLVATFHNYYLDRAFGAHAALHQRLHYRTDLRAFTRLALARADCVTAVSHFVADLVRRDSGYQGDIKVIHNGVDPTRFKPRASPARDKIRVGFAGNLSRRKAAHLLPEICKHLSDDIEIVVAQGLRAAPTSSRRARVVKSQGATIQYLGRVARAEMPAFYQSLDVLLSPSFREGFGLVVLEAMSCGLPVVASTGGAMPELLQEQGGMLRRAGDVRGFADALNQLARDNALREQMGRFNRQSIERQFTEQRMLENYASLFAELGA